MLLSAQPRVIHTQPLSSSTDTMCDDVDDSEGGLLFCLYVSLRECYQVLKGSYATFSKHEGCISRDLYHVP
jgi:hypothetical protein